MSIQPKSEHLKRTITWISEQLKYNQDKKKETIFEEACFRFNLSPNDSEFIRNFLKEDDED